MIRSRTHLRAQIRTQHSHLLSTFFARAWLMSRLNQLPQQLLLRLLQLLLLLLLLLYYWPFNYYKNNHYNSSTNCISLDTFLDFTDSQYLFNSVFVTYAQQFSTNTVLTLLNSALLIYKFEGLFKAMQFQVRCRIFPTE